MPLAVDKRNLNVVCVYIRHRGARPGGGRPACGFLSIMGGRQLPSNNSDVQNEPNSNKFRPVDEQLAILMRGVDCGDPQTRDNMEKELRARLAGSKASGKPLRVYCGFDPSRSDLHLGHTIPMRKLRQFQELGHQVVFLIGSFTGTIGDPSHQDSARAQ